MFAVVEFIDSSALSVVPLLWIFQNDHMCYFPKNSVTPIKQLVQEEQPFKQSWRTYKIKVHFKTFYYNDAEKKINELIEASEYESSQSNHSTRSLRKLETENTETINENSNNERNKENNNPVIAPTANLDDSSSVTGSEDLLPLSLSTMNTLLPCTCNKDFQNTVISELAKLTLQSSQLSIMMDQLLRSANNIVHEEMPSDLPRFPIASIEEFDLFENQLENKSLRSYMIKRLAAVGGSGVNGLTNRIMNFLLSNEVAMSFNWKGRDKRPFEKTNLMQTVYEGAKLNFPPEEATDKIVAATVKDWLKGAKARKARRDNKQ